MAEAAGAPVSHDVFHEIEQFLYREARCLDEERYRDWLAMLTDDIHYWMPLNENRFRRDRRPEIGETDVAIYNERRRDLEMRVARFESRLVWIEDPPNRTRHVITNIEANWIEPPAEAEVLSNFTAHRSRREIDSAILAGNRVDRMRIVDGRWKLCRRKIVLAQNVVLDKNLGVFL
ncbi:MAG TPA: 3-phenylpropionate/cinnamic acid dioxygenase subunit beta [Candidatus Binataceae bacterium]|nr:3-phenylpropionate/cinnamic acid dioxygenase subunit beta [Candidatus Binataceae bacterium]